MHYSATQTGTNELERVSKFSAKPRYVAVSFLYRNNYNYVTNYKINLNQFNKIFFKINKYII